MSQTVYVRTSTVRPSVSLEINEHTDLMAIVSPHMEKPTCSFQLGSYGMRVVTESLPVEEVRAFAEGLLSILPPREEVK